MTNFQDFINTVLLEASEIANDNFGKISGTVKPGDNNQVLTTADLEIGTLLVSRVRQTYPEHNVIDEEAGVIDNQSEFTWVIDPIDGTSNFANGVHTYGIMIGLLKGGVPIAGGISLPFFNEIYTAAKGEGSYCNGNKLVVTQETRLLNCLVAYGIDGHQGEPDITNDEARILAKIILNIRNLRSSNSTYDSALVANGKYGANLNRTSKIWDNVAPQIIIEEAGGVYTDFFGAPIDYDNPITKINDNFTWCAGASALHAQLQKIIHAG